MEDFKKEQENSEVTPVDGLERIDTPLEAAEIKEFQENLKEIDQLEPEEKVKFMDKLKNGLKKVGNASLMVGGVVVAVSGMAVAGISISEIDFGNISESTNALPESTRIIQQLSLLSVALGAVAGIQGGINLTEK